MVDDTDPRLNYSGAWSFVTIDASAYSEIPTCLSPRLWLLSIPLRIDMDTHRFRSYIQ